MKSFLPPGDLDRVRLSGYCGWQTAETSGRSRISTQTGLKPEYQQVVMRALLAPPLVDRTEEQALLAGLAQEVCEGSGRVVLIEGEAGIGKSRLMAEAIAQADGLRQHWWGAAEADDDRPFAALADALGCRRTAVGPAQREIAAMLTGDGASDGGSPRSTDAPELQFRLVEAFVDLVENLLRSAVPGVLVLDDLHWADEGTLVALRQIGRRLRALPLLVIGAYRPLPAAGALDRTIASLRTSGAASISLGPLDGTAVADLARQLHGAPPGDSLLYALDGAAGNPLFVVELARAALAEGAVEVVADRAELRSPGLPPTFRALIRHRVQDLPAEAVDVLRVAAVLGSSFSVADLCIVLDRRAVQLLGPLGHCVDDGLLRDDGDALAFRHDLIRDAIRQDLSGDLERELHRDIGRALATAEGPTLRAAHHLVRGARPGDNDAVGWLYEAARQAAAAAPVLALGLLDRALDLSQPDDPVRVAILIERARALLWAGRLSEGRELAERLLAAGGGPDVAALHETLATAFFLEGRLAEVVDQLERASADPSLPASGRAFRLAEASLGHVVAGDLERAIAQAEEARGAGSVLGDDGAQCLALCTLALVAHIRGDATRALELAEQAVLLFGMEGSAAARYAPHFFQGLILLSTDRVDDAAKAFAIGRQQCELSGNFATLPIHHLGAGLQMLLAGEWDDAVAEIEVGLAVSEELGTRVAVVALLALRALIAIERGEMDIARRAVADADAEIARSGLQFGIDWLTWARALLVEDDDASGAFQVLYNGWQFYEAVGALWSCTVLGPDLVRIAIATGNPDVASSVAARITALSASFRTDTARGTALRCQGLIDDDGDTLLASVAAYRTGRRPYDLALAREDAAVALAHRERRTEAATLAGEALNEYDRLSATRDVARATARFRAVGLRLGRRGPQRRAAVGWDSLTPSERDVSHLVAEGLTNREIGQRLFVSPRTVETHVGHVFGKLGLTSRSALAAEVAARANA
jgi:DNA-binding CsgD family transcriptional regulator